MAGPKPDDAEDAPKPDRARGGSDPTPDEGPFDRWLTDKLRQMYGAIVDEPLPDDLVELVKQSAKPAKGGSSDGTE